MIRSLRTIPIIALALAGCGEQARQSVDAGTGPSPTLLDPVKTLFPTVKVEFSRACSPAAQDLVTKVWTTLLQ